MLQTYEDIKNTLTIFNKKKVQDDFERNRSRSKSADKKKDKVKKGETSNFNSTQKSEKYVDITEIQSLDDELQSERPVRMENSREKNPKRSGIKVKSKKLKDTINISKEVSFEDKSLTLPNNYKSYKNYQDSEFSDKKPSNREPHYTNKISNEVSNRDYERNHRSMANTITKDEYNIQDQYKNDPELEKSIKLKDKLKTLVSDYKTADLSPNIVKQSQNEYQSHIHFNNNATDDRKIANLPDVYYNPSRAFGGSTDNFIHETPLHMTSHTAGFNRKYSTNTAKRAKSIENSHYTPYSKNQTFNYVDNNELAYTINPNVSSNPKLEESNRELTSYLQTRIQELENEILRREKKDRELVESKKMVNKLEKQNSEYKSNLTKLQEIVTVTSLEKQDLNNLVFKLQSEIEMLQKNYTSTQGQNDSIK